MSEFSPFGWGGFSQVVIVECSVGLNYSSACCDQSGYGWIEHGKERSPIWRTDAQTANAVDEITQRLFDCIAVGDELVEQPHQVRPRYGSYSASVKATKTNICLRKFTCHNRTYHPGARSTLGWQATGWCVLAAQDTRGIATQAE